MSSTPLTLAALATSAVPGLRVFGARAHAFGGEDAFTSAVIVTEDAELIVRVPRSSAAEVQQSAEMLGLAALAPGARTALPFSVPETLGMTRAGETRAVVSTFLPGGRIAAHDLADDALLLHPIAEALAAIHRLPVSLVQQSGLPIRSAEDARQSAARIVERAAATRLLPDTVHARWLDVLASPRFWDFAPTVVHGSLDADQLLIQDDRVVGVLGWSELSVGDPAVDLAWLLAAGLEVLDTALAHYTELRGSGGRIELQARARFYHELEVARWLLHGVETHDDAVIDDAVSMMDRLVDRLTRMGDPVPTRSVASADEVERMLDQAPELPADPRSETAEYESLDEDRVFDSDGDFAEAADATDGSTAEGSSADGSTADGSAADGESAEAARSDAPRDRDSGD